jgi:sugar lactone lactonase YvrE
MNHDYQPALRLLSLFLLAAAGCSDPASDPFTLARFDAEAGEFPEGVAIDEGGRVYVSLTRLGQLLEIAPGSSAPRHAGEVAGLLDGDFGLLGLAVDGEGDVHGVVASESPQARGVWRFDARTGAATRMDGTQAIAFPNSVAFDGTTMYVTDTIGPDGRGAVWRVQDGGEAELWAQDELLAGDGSLGFGFPLGPNGVAVHGGTVFVGLTELASIAAIPIAADGSAGSVSIIADLAASGPSGGPILVDGIDVDAGGTIYLAAPLDHSVFSVSSDGEEVSIVASASDGLDAPTSVVLGQDAFYIASFSAGLEGASNGNGPTIIAVPRAGSGIRQ